MGFIICIWYHFTNFIFSIFILLGMVGMMGAAALTKKRGGYTNTKLHGIMAWVGMMIAGGGLYVIYQNKESMGKNHFTTYHSWGKWSVLYCVYYWRSIYTMKLFLICSIQSTWCNISWTTTETLYTRQYKPVLVHWVDVSYLVLLVQCFSTQILALISKTNCIGKFTSMQAEHSWCWLGVQLYLDWKHW